MACDGIACSELPVQVFHQECFLSALWTAHVVEEGGPFLRDRLLSRGETGMAF